MQLQINGETRDYAETLTVNQLLVSLGLDGRKIALERNLEIVPRSQYGQTALSEGDRIEIVHFIGGGANAAEAEPAREREEFVVAGRRFARV